MTFEKPPGIGLEEYERLNARRFGTANPERVRNPVWEHMVRTQESPFFARQAYGVDSYSAESPCWTFLRFGMPEVWMPDGRRIAVAGEHENSYDPEFCIYNDVIVRTGDDVEIYAYPRGVFPPTDFHTATLVDDTIWLLGSLGYALERSPERAQVFRLDPSTYEMARVEAGGVPVPQIYNHRARLLPDGVTIEVRGGKRSASPDPKARSEPNTSIYRFDTTKAEWLRVGDTSKWRRFVCPIPWGTFYHEDAHGGWWSGKPLIELPYEVRVAPPMPTVYEQHTPPTHTLIVDGAPVCVIPDYDHVRIDFEGGFTGGRVQEVVGRLRELLLRSVPEASPAEEQPFGPGHSGM